MAKKKGFRFSNFQTDESLESEGVWIDYTSGFRLKLARIGCPEYKEYMIKHGKPHVRGIEKGHVDNDVAEQLLKNAIAETIIKDWEGLLDENDKEIPYSKETAKKLLETAHDFYEEVYELAKDREFFKAEETEGTVKN